MALLTQSPSKAPTMRALAATTAFTPVVWGTTYFTATQFLPSGRPLLAATVRALPVGLVFIARSRKLPTGDWWWRAFILGALNIGAFFALLFVAAFRLPGGVAAIAGGFQPLVAATIGAVVLGEPFTRRTAGLCAVAVAGVAMLVLTPAARLDSVGLLAAMGGTLSMATGIVLTKRWGRPVDLITFTGWQLTGGGLILLPLLVIFEGFPDQITARNLVGFTWLAVIGTGVAYSLWFRGIQRLPIATVSFLVLLSPLVATLLGWFALDQHLRPIQLLGGALVASAVVGAQTAPRDSES
jgi:probable blue pigment (indigoidine) exporter